MSNQRPGKYEKKLDRNGDMQVFKFFKTAQKVLEDSGKEDEAFNMEQMVDWLNNGRRGEWRPVKPKEGSIRVENDLQLRQPTIESISWDKVASSMAKPVVEIGQCRERAKPLWVIGKTLAFTIISCKKLSGFLPDAF